MTDCELLKYVQQAQLKTLIEDVPASLREDCPPLFGLPTLRVGSRFPIIWNPVDIGTVPA
jgi:hypothetical protein